MSERVLCPCCKILPVAINYVKDGRTYYRKKCNPCYRKHKKPLPSSWVRSGYAKKDACEKCRFRFKFSEQAFVVHIDGNIENCDWTNLRTICANCQIEMSHSTMKWKPAKITADF